MALIKCPECGKEVSDKAGKCPNCGCPVGTPSNKKSKTPIIIAVIAVLVVCIIGVIFIVKNQEPKLPELNDKEKYALGCIEKIYNNLKNPDSLQVHVIEWIDDKNEPELEADYFYIDLSAQNSMGGLTRDSYIFNYSHQWSYNNDVEGKNLRKEVPVGAIVGFSNQQEGKGEKLDVDKIMEVFNATH